MQNPEGQIVSVSSHAGQHTAIVRVAATDVCARCAEGKGCGAGLLGGRGGTRDVEAVVADQLDVVSGDTVKIEIAPANLLRASLLIYGYPLLGAVLFAAIGSVLEWSDSTTAALALAGLVSGGLIARSKLAGRDCLREFTPIVTERLTTGAP